MRKLGLIRWNELSEVSVSERSGDAATQTSSDNVRRRPLQEVEPLTPSVGLLLGTHFQGYNVGRRGPGAFQGNSVTNRTCGQCAPLT